MLEFVHQRHKQVTSLRAPRELIIACPEMQSHINVSRMVRAAACCGVTRFIACGNVKIDPKISRGGEQQMSFEVRRSLRPVLQKLQRAGYPLIGLEQTTNSQNIHQLDRKSVV